MSARGSVRADRADLVAMIEAITRTRPAAYWYEACERAGSAAHEDRQRGGDDGAERWHDAGHDHHRGPIKMPGKRSGHLMG